MAKAIRFFELNSGAKIPSIGLCTWKAAPNVVMGHSVLPKSTNEKRIKENFDVFDWCIPEELCAKFSEIEQVRLITGSAFVHETFGSYKTVEDIWDGEI